MQSRHVLELPNDLGAIERSVEYLLERCRDAGFDEAKLRLNLRVGVAEALANAMMYGNGRDPAKRVTIEAWCGPDEVRIRITDEGRGFDPEKLPDPTLPDNRTRNCGRGVFLIRKLMDRVEYNDRGNSIEMVLLGPGEGGRASLAT